MFSEGISTVISDLKWLSLVLSFSSGPHSSVDERQDHIDKYPKTFRRLVSKLSRSRCANLPKPAVTVSGSGAGSFACNVWDSESATVQKLNLHMFKAHGHKNIWRLYVDTLAYCSVWVKQPWSRERLLNFIRYKSKICTHNLLLQGPICSEAEAKQRLSNMMSA